MKSRADSAASVCSEPACGIQYHGGAVCSL